MSLVKREIRNRQQMRMTPNYPQTTRFSAFCIAFHIFVVGGPRKMAQIGLVRDFKFSR